MASKELLMDYKNFIISQANLADEADFCNEDD